LIQKVADGFFFATACRATTALQYNSLYFRISSAFLRESRDYYFHPRGIPATSASSPAWFQGNPRSPIISVRLH